MSQCVPSWDLDEFSSPSAQFSGSPDVPRAYYEVAELTWENGQLALHGLGPPRVPSKPNPAAASPKYNAWNKPRASGTLESIVNQATLVPQPQLKNGVNITGACSLDDAVPWLHRRLAASSSAVNMDAMVPCANPNPAVTAGLPNYIVGSSTRVGSCSAANDEDPRSKRARVARVPVAGEWSGRDLSASASATFGRESQRVTVDSYGLGLTSTSFGSQDNTSCGQPETRTVTVDENDSASHSRPQMEVDVEEKKKDGKSSVSTSTKRSRAAAIHNQSERKRRDKINQRMKTLQKLVPNSSKTDKASMLDEVIEYLKQLQAQIQMMSRMQPMMMPLAMQQLQMSMMNQAAMNMGLGMGMGNVMDHMNSLNRVNMGGLPPMLPPGLFMPMAHWDGSGDNRFQQSQASIMPDPMTAALMACQSQPITMEAYSRMVAMYQQLQQQQQPPASSSKS